jgi:hypothetical protein
MGFSAMNPTSFLPDAGSSIAPGLLVAFQLGVEAGLVTMKSS